MKDTIALRLDNVSYTYQNASKNRKTAVDGVTLEIYEGEIFGLVGESGCGKTTLGKLIVDLLKPTEGSITFGLNTSKKSQRDIQMIFQDPYASLNPRLRVQDIIAEGIDIHHLYPTRELRKQAIETLIHTVGLDTKHLSRFPHEFSGGQRQRIGIARALAVQPKFIICDEPISALDVSIQAQIVNLLKALQQEADLTYLFISHDLGMVHYLSDRIGVMVNGKLVEYGSADAVYHNPTHPYTQTLLQAIPGNTRFYDVKKADIVSQENHKYVYQSVEANHYVLVDEEGRYVW